MLDKLTSDIKILDEMGQKVNLLEIKNVEDNIYKEICSVVKR